MLRKEKTRETKRQGSNRLIVYPIMILNIYYQNLGKTSSSKKVDRVSPAKSPVEDASKSQCKLWLYTTCVVGIPCVFVL